VSGIDQDNQIAILTIINIIPKRVNRYNEYIFIGNHHHKFKYPCKP